MRTLSNMCKYTPSWYVRSKQTIARFQYWMKMAKAIYLETKHFLDSLDYKESGCTLSRHILNQTKQVYAF